MAIPLSEPKRWHVAVLMFLAAAYTVLCAKEFAASIYAARPDLAKLEQAVRLSPGNADYRHRLAKFLTLQGHDPQLAVSAYQSAVALNPYDAGYWLDLAAAYQVVDNNSGQRLALDRALEAEPTAPDVAWKAANFFLVDGQTDRALREFRVVIENDTTMAGPSLQACWRVQPDAAALLTDVVPPQKDALIAFLSLMMSKQQTEGAMQTWERLTRLHEKFENSLMFEYIRYLIQAHRPDAAVTAWQQAAEVQGLTAYLPTDDNAILNGDFSLDVLNGGFDWTYVNRGGVRAILDASDFRVGHRSLSLTFEGPGISDAGIQQLIPVRGGATYDFSAYYKSSDFEGAGGPQIVIRDTYSNAALFTSDPLIDADFWKAVHSKFTTQSSTTLLTLSIERSPAGSPIRGKLWLDDFQLSPADSGGDKQYDPGRDKP